MKVAIPLFGNWISPRFGFSPEMWIITIENGEVVSQERIFMAGLALPQWFTQLSSLQVNTLICGGIDGFCHRQLDNLGISIIPEIAGEARMALNLFLNGKLEPGCRICGRRRSGYRGRRGRFFGPPWVIDDKKKNKGG